MCWIGALRYDQRHVHDSLNRIDYSEEVPSIEECSAGIRGIKLI